MSDRQILLDGVEDGIFNPETLLRDLVNWMSEAEVKEFTEANGYEVETDDE